MTKKQLPNNALQKLVRRKFPLLRHIFYDAIEWQNSLGDAWTLRPWHMTGESRRKAKQYYKNAKKYMALLRELHEANK
jgi:hypothetical protein